MNTGNTALTQNARQDVPITIVSVTEAARALADLLAVESGFMDTMHISKVAELQDRKLKLTGLMERYMHYLNKNPDVFARATAEEKAGLRTANAYLTQVMQENYEKLLVARAINRAVVTCVTGIYAKKGGNEIYDARGVMYDSYRAPVSMTLNKVI